MKTKLTKTSRGHYKIFCLTDKFVIPEEEAEQIKFASLIVDKIENTTCDCLYSHRSTKKGFLVAVYSLDSVYYLVNSIKTEHKDIEITSIYILDSENDSISIAKFIASNISTIMKDYSQQLNDAKIGASKYNEIS